MADITRTLFTAFLNICGGLVFLIALPMAFVIPALVGLYLIYTRPHGLGLMAGLLTLKPLLTTPLWFILSIATSPPPGSGPPLPDFITIIPGASLTLITLIVFRQVIFSPHAGAALILLVLDCARWFNSYLMLLLRPSRGVADLQGIFIVLGLTLPIVFAAVALVVSRVAARQAA